MGRAPPHADAPDLRPRFRSLAGAVRARLALRHALAGATAALAAAVPLATAAWATRHTAWVLPLVALGAAGALAGLLVARGRRWSDRDVALFLDARLGGREAVTTALALAPDAPAAAAVHAAAAATLARARAATLPRPWRRAHAAAPACASWVLALALVPRAPAPRAAPTAPGAERVLLDAVPGLDEAARLADVRPADARRRERLARLADEARRLRAQLRAGATQRAALDSLARLQEALAAERMAPGSGDERRGLERAIAHLARAGLDEMARALGDHDFEALDRAAERLADAREAADRRRAREALRAAAEAAAGEGAPGVAEALRDEERLLRRRERRHDALSALARMLGHDPDVRRAAEHLDRSRSDAASRRLAAAMEEALSRMSPAERQRLAERMRQAARGAEGPSGADLDGREGERPMTADELLAALRAMAREGQGEGEGQGGQGGRGVPLPTARSGASPGDVQRALEGAMRGVEGARRQVGGQGSGRGRGSASGREPGTGAPGGSGAGGDHAGRTGAVRGDPLRARTRAPVGRGAPMPGGTPSLSSGRASGAARVLRTGDLRSAAAREIHGVERSDIPREYRDQVRTYFQP